MAQPERLTIPALFCGITTQPPSEMIGWLQAADMCRRSVGRSIQCDAMDTRRQSSAVETSSHDFRHLDEGSSEIVPATSRIVVIPLVNQPDPLELPLLARYIIETAVHRDRGHDRIIRAA